MMRILRRFLALTPWALVITMAALLTLSAPDRQAWAQAEVPAEPTGLEATEIAYDRVALAWDDPGDSSITGYRVLRRNVDGDEYGDGKGAAEFTAVADDTGTAETSYTDTTVTPRTRYVYRVEARNAAGLSWHSHYLNVRTPALNAPRAPRGLEAREVSHDRVSLEWEDPENRSITGYQVLRRSVDGEEYGDGEGAGEYVAVVDDTGTSETAYTDRTVGAGTRYGYRVRARNATGLSGRSGNLSVETGALRAPAEPTGLEAREVSHDRVLLEWDDPDDGSITGYRVLRRPVDGDEYGDGEGPGEYAAVSEDTGTAETGYTDTTVEGRTRYAYRVQAINAAGVSGRSVSRYVSTPPEAPVWTAEMEVGDQGKRVGSEDTYVGYSYFKGTATLVPDRFEHEGRAVAVYALAYSERAGRLAILTSRPLERGLWLQVSGEEYAIAGAAVSRGTDVNYRIYEWEGVELDWEVGEVVSVGLALGEIVLPNVVIILADDLGWGDLGTNNPDSAMTTPNMDGIAAAGVNFTDAHSPSSSCTGTRYGLLTGRYSWRTWMTSGVLNGYDRPLIAPDRPTLGTLLQGRGYRTAAVGKWHLGMDFTRLTDVDRVNSINRGIDFDAEIVDAPVDHGFDEFFGVSANNTWNPNVFIRNDRFLANPDRDARTDPNFTHSWEIVQDRLTGEATSFIERSAESDDPFFLYFPLTAPHLPIVPATRFRGTTGLGRYGDFVAQVDWTVGQVLDTLKRVGEYDNTLVIVTSDNGSYMGRLSNHFAHDHTTTSSILAYRHETHRSNGSWAEKKGSAYEGGHRIPLMLQWPAAWEAGSTYDDTVSLADLYATLANIVGSEPTAGAATDSVSLLPLLRGKAWDRGKPVIHHSSRSVFAIRDGEWKLILDDPAKLFDLADDPGETDDLSSRQPGLVTQLRASLNEIRATEEGTLSSDATLRSLNLAGIDLGAFAPDVHDYAVVVSRNVRSVEVVAIPAATDARAEIRTANGRLGYGKPLRGRVEVELAGTVTTISVRVMSPDDSATTHYTVRVTRDGALTIAGTPRVGETLTADTAAITDPDGLENVSFRHQWLRNDGTTDAEIAGATGSGHTLVKADQGKTIRVRVSFTDDAGNAETRTSEPTATVERRSNRPATGQPTIEGVAQVGRTLTAEVSAIGDGNGMEEAVLSYQWLRDDAEIDGATGAAYPVEAEDAGHSLSVRVSFTDDDGYEEGVSSGAVAVPSPLTGAFDVSTAPESHDGENAFELQMYFSEEPDIGYGSVRSHVLEVENGRVTGARRHDRESSAPNIRWVVIVEPEGDADVTVVLPPTRDCDDEGAVCTGGGKMLSNRSSITVPGPGQESVEPPSKPTGLTGTLNADGSITLSWRAPEGEVTGYQILRRRPEQGETSLAVYVDDTGTEAATYTDTEVTGEGHYVYRVKARNAAGLGPQSNFVKIER